MTSAEDDAGDKGRVIPSMSVNQLGASMGCWMGLSQGDLNDVFPDLVNFGTDWQAELNLLRDTCRIKKCKVKLPIESAM